MKLTKQQLKEIIREELAKLTEGPVDPPREAAIARLRDQYGDEKVEAAIENARKYPGFPPSLSDVKDNLGVPRDRSGGGF